MSNRRERGKRLHPEVVGRFSSTAPEWFVNARLLGLGRESSPIHAPPASGSHHSLDSWSGSTCCVPLPQRKRNWRTIGSDLICSPPIEAKPWMISASIQACPNPGRDTLRRMELITPEPQSFTVPSRSARDRGPCLRGRVCPGGHGRSKGAVDRDGGRA